MNTDVLNLGKLLVKELGLNSSTDTLARWMAHYIAQQMQEAEEGATKEDKQAAEEKCFETILKLWKHRAYYKTGNKPFENFEPIFQTLDRLNPDNDDPFYFQSEYSAKLKSDNKNDDDLKQYLLLATKIDEIVRVWMKFIFQHAAQLAMDEKTKGWLKAATPLNDNDEASLIVQILSDQEVDEIDTDHYEQEKAKLIEHRVEQLKSFRKINEDLIAMYQEELNALTLNESC